LSSKRRKKQKTDPSAPKQSPQAKVRPFSPFSLYFVLPGLVLWFLFGTITQSIQEGGGLLAEIVGSFRLLFLTMTLFFLVTGLIGYIIYPEVRINFHNSLKKRILRRKDIS
jgi:hypothetical protein